MSRYGAFLSYSRVDLIFARRLHAALEAYRMPKNAGESEAAEKPDRISPIFRDQDEVSASSNLEATIKQALQDSSALIVIASPNAAVSQWVNAEIEEFERLGGAKRIFVAIPPDTPAERGFQVSSIFPPALHRLGEPLAADFRASGDGWTLAKLKLVAAVARVDLVRLRDRDAARRLRRNLVSSVTALLVLGVVGVTAANWWQADQRARGERIERSIEAVRTNLQSDQAGVALAYVDSLRGMGLAADANAALNRVGLFWNDELDSPADAVAAIPVGSTYSFNHELYYRGQKGPMHLPVANAKTAFQRAGTDHLFMAGDDGVFHRVNAATGDTSIPPGQPAGGFSPEDIYELPNGALILTTTSAPGASMAGSREIAYVAYPNGENSGFVRMGVHLSLHANDACTKLYFADGAQGYGSSTEVLQRNAKYVQVLYEDNSIYADEPYRLGVVTLDTHTSDWREAPLLSGTVNSSTVESFTDTWLADHGAPLNEVCARYHFDSSYIAGNATELHLPTVSFRAWRHDPSISQAAVWARVGGWFNGVSSDTSDTPHIFWQSDQGRFAVFESFGAYQGATYTFCSHPNGGSAHCITHDGDSEGELDHFPHAGFVKTVDGLMDMRTLSLIPWKAEAVSEAPDGRTLMSFANGTITTHDYTPGTAPTQIASFADPDIAELVAVQAINASEALVVTREGRLMRVDVARRRIEWSVRDRELATFLSGQPYVGPIGVVQLAASPDGQYGAVLLVGSVRLYELSMGMPLTPSAPLEKLGVRAFLRPIMAVDDDGSVRISGAGAGEGLVRRAPQLRQLQGDTACLYGARVVNGQVQAVDIFGNPEMMRQCGYANVSSTQP